ncbi:MAG: 50S ribosomal protein L25/general stress protein Ctc, partial [candidate division Zixibacteria bacterium]|nr:50S ribosomal protein L25/general stress protein Ctc [candidate division Zixibacteria bacterium]
SVGKGPARRKRMAGSIPAVVYGPEVEPIPISLDEKAFRSTMNVSGRMSSLIKLDVEGNMNMVVMREVQLDPLTSKILHIDFHAISMTEPINLSIPVSFVGTPRGVKTDGGIMQITMREIDISCLPSDIPEKIEVDVSDLGIGDSIHVSEVTIPNTTIMSSEQRTIVVIAAPTVVKAETAEEVEEELAEGEEAAESAETAEGDETPKEDEKGKK